MPKYKKIYEAIKTNINNDFYKKTENQIPDELTLCNEFNCSRMTIKKALDLLVQEGLIYRKRGHGSFVLEKTLTHRRINLSDEKLNGLTKSTKGKATSIVLEFNLIFSDSTISSILNIEENTPIYEISRLRLLDNEPYVLEKTYMSSNLITGLNKDILKNSIYDYIENTLNLKISSAKKIIRADTSNDYDITHLKLKKYDPVLEIEQIAYLNNGIPFEYSICRHRYDVFEFTSFSVRN